LWKAVVFSVLCLAFVASASEPSTYHREHLAQDITVIVSTKESPVVSDATERMLEALPEGLIVYIVPFEPMTDQDAVRRQEELIAAHDNVHLLPGAPVFPSFGDSRKHALESGVVKTKYFLSVENVAYFDSGLVERLYGVAESLRTEEIVKGGVARTVAVIPRLVERCEGETSMWYKRRHSSHSQFRPTIRTSEKTGRRYIDQGYIGHESAVAFEKAGYSEGREFGEASGFVWEEWIQRPPVGKLTEVEGVGEVNFMEDHVVLYETEFCNAHREQLFHSDMLWFDDHLTQVGTMQAFGKRVVTVTDAVAYLQFFCEWDLDVANAIAWRRSEALLVRACQMEEKVLGVTVSYSCWSWSYGVKANIFYSIVVPDVIGEFPSFAPGEPLSAYKHASLATTIFLLASHNQYRFKVTAIPGSSADSTTGDIEHVTAWMEETEALRWLYARLRNGGNGEEGSKLFMQGKKEIVDVHSEEYEEKQRATDTLLLPLPGAYSSLPSAAVADERWPEGLEIDTSLPDSCLYHTGPVVRSGAVSLLARSANIALSYAPQEDGEEELFDYIIWTSCSGSQMANFYKDHVTLLTGSLEEWVRIPSSPSDGSVLAQSFRGRRR